MALDGGIRYNYALGNKGASISRKLWKNEEKVAILEKILLSEEAAAVIRTEYRVSAAVEGIWWKESG